MPIINIPEKVCLHCGGTEWYARKVFRKKTQSEGYRYVCNLKKTEIIKEWVKKNPEKYAKGRKKVRLDINYKEKSSVYQKTNVQTLSDRYIVSTIITAAKARGVLYKKDIPQDLIDMKRTQLLLKRQIA